MICDGTDRLIVLKEASVVGAVPAFSGSGMGLRLCRFRQVVWNCRLDFGPGRISTLRMLRIITRFTPMNAVVASARQS